MCYFFANKTLGVCFGVSFLPISSIHIINHLKIFFIINYKMDSGSWIWDDYDNSTLDNNNICENVTNHWLYFIFSGYLLPLISPRVRDWFRESVNSLKNSSVGGQIVTLTEYGFQKIQDIENNDEMKEYIRRLVKEKNPSLFYSEESLEKLAILFSGDEKMVSQFILKKLNNIIKLGTHFYVSHLN